MKFLKHTRGFTLIEIMVAITISLILLGGVMKLMKSSKQTYDYQGDMARVQENGRFAVDFISKSLRMAGYFGCTSEPPTPAYFAVSGFDADDPANPLTAPFRPNASDSFTLSYLDTDRTAFAIIHCPRDPADGVRKNEMGNPCNPDLTTPTPLPLELDDTKAWLGGAAGSGLTENPINLNRPNLNAVRRGDLQVGDVVVAADCLGSEIQTVREVTDTRLIFNTKLNTRPGLSRGYLNAGKSYGAEMRKLVTYRYFVAADPADATRLSLYRDIPMTCVTDLDGSNRRFSAVPDPTLLPNLDPNQVCDTDHPALAEPLIEGIESMQVRYGEDTDGDSVPNTYRRAHEVGEWSDVRSVRLTLLVHTAGDVRQDRDPDTRTYVLDPNYSFTPATANRDQTMRRRQVFSTTIELRNNSF